MKKTSKLYVKKLIKELFEDKDLAIDYLENFDTIISVYNILSDKKYSEKGMDELIRMAFKNKWNVKKDITKYRNITSHLSVINCDCTVQWYDDVIDNGYIEMYPSGDILIANVIREATGEIRQGRLTI